MMWILFLAFSIGLCIAADNVLCNKNHYLVNGTCEECQNGTTVPDDGHDIEMCFRDGHDKEFYATELGGKLILVCQATDHPKRIEIRRGNDTMQINVHNPRNFKYVLSVKYNVSCDEDWNTFQCSVTGRVGNVSLIPWNNTQDFQKKNLCRAARETQTPTPTEKTKISAAVDVTVTDVGAGTGSWASPTSTTAASTEDSTAIIVGSVVSAFILIVLVVVGVVCAVCKKKCSWKTEKPGINAQVEN